MIRYYRDIEQGEEWLIRSPRHPDSQRNAADPDADLRPASNDKERLPLFELIGNASPATPSRTTSATTCYAGTKMRSGAHPIR